MNEVLWLSRDEIDVPDHDDWLTPGEKLIAGSLATARRRASWRLGRWTGKAALRLVVGDAAPPLEAVDIHSAPSGAPEAYFWNVAVPWRLSLSHRAGKALCALGRADQPLGCDLEFVEPRDESFVADYFAPAEQTLVARTPAAHRDTLVTMLWSAKESVLKALGDGLHRDTREVPIATAPNLRMDEWMAFEAHVAGGLPPWPGWCQARGSFVWTFAGPGLQSPPAEMAVP